MTTQSEKQKRSSPPFNITHQDDYELFSSHHPVRINNLTFKVQRKKMDQDTTSLSAKARCFAAL